MFTHHLTIFYLIHHSPYALATLINGQTWDGKLVPFYCSPFCPVTTPTCKQRGDSLSGCLETSTLGRVFFQDCIATLHHDLSLTKQSHWAAGTPLPFVLLLAEQIPLSHPSSHSSAMASHSLKCLVVFGTVTHIVIKPVTQWFYEVKISHVILYYCPGWSMPLTMATAGQRQACLALRFKRTLNFSSNPVENGPRFPITLCLPLLHHPGPSTGPAGQFPSQFRKSDAALSKWAPGLPFSLDLHSEDETSCLWLTHL